MSLLVSSMGKGYHTSDYISYTDLQLGSRVKLTFWFLVHSLWGHGKLILPLQTCRYEWRIVVQVKVNLPDAVPSLKKQDKIQCLNQELLNQNQIQDSGQSVRETFSWATPLYFCFLTRKKKKKKSNLYGFFQWIFWRACRAADWHPQTAEAREEGGGFCEGSWTVFNCITNLQIS